MRLLLPAALLIGVLGSQSATAQSVQAYVQFGPSVQPIAVSQNSNLNIVGIFQFGGTPQASVSQTGRFNAAGIEQVGLSTGANVNQTGSFNLSSIGQVGSTNSAALTQFGAVNQSVVRQSRH